MNMFDERLARIEKALSECVPTGEGLDDQLVYEAARYSLLAGGKRVRPTLLLEFASMFGVREDVAMPFACAIECIHTYSLIHDDLPCMDDDDLRRNRPTNHKVYGEAIALLAGDALLNRAYELLLSAVVDEKSARAARYIANCAGVCGMVGGQCIDLANEGHKISPDLLLEMHSKKTAALIRAACVGGALLGTNEEWIISYVTEYAVELGMAFQIKDDILDVEGNAADLGKNVGMDAQMQKNTFVSVFGLSKAKKMAAVHTNNAINALNQLPFDDFLDEYTETLLNRKH